MTSRFVRLVGGPAVDPDELRLAGIVAGALYVMAAITLALFVVLPGVTHSHRVALILIALVGALWGACSIAVINWDRAREWVVHFSSLFGFVMMALAIASTGGATSPAWVYLFLAAVFAAYFYRRAVAIFYLVGCVATQAAPLLYDPRALHGTFPAQFAIAAPAYLVLGGAIIAGKRRMFTLRSRSEELAAEQSALRRVATAVVGGEYPEFIYELVAREVALLLRGGAAGILRFDDPFSATVMGSWADHPGGRYLPGTIVEIKPGSDVEQARDAGVPVRIDDHPSGSAVDRLGYAASIVSPVQVSGRPWGVLAVTASSARFKERDEHRLMAFGDLLATAIVSIEDRQKLAAQASSDPLTGLANHRTLQTRLAAEVARAVRHERPLSVAVIDIDQFKRINDHGGHEIGDEMLMRVAGCLRTLARSEDTLGRMGGDEFAWVLPDTDRRRALVAVERARRAIADSVSEPFRLSVSAGICDTTITDDPAQLISFADGALYWSKAHGRDQCWIYDPEVIDELSASERVERLERSHTLVGLRALARAIEARDPETRRHSERVSRLAGKLARAAGWSDHRARMLEDAALVHDVGKIAIPDDLLGKQEPLTRAERAQLESHAELAAKIVDDVLAPDQVEWIRHHRERPAGTGYPLGLTGDQIPEGASLLAAADLWDAMSTAGMAPGEALAECVVSSGRELTESALKALVKLHAAGEFDDLPGGDELDPDLVERAS
jgi:diguanylate cyclase (GGDEF)-like protein